MNLCLLTAYKCVRVKNNVCYLRAINTQNFTVQNIIIAGFLVIFPHNSFHHGDTFHSVKSMSDTHRLSHNLKN